MQNDGRITKTVNKVFSCIGRYTLLMSAGSLVLLLGISGCAFFSVNTMQNDRLLPKSEPKRTAAVQSITAQELSDELFIGIAMSGGGSRAANFSAAVLLELEKIGILQKATALSSVSGSSLPTAYYGLYGIKKDTTRWNNNEVRKRMRENYESSWLWRWFWPQNILSYWFSNFNRSDIMKEVLDNKLFHERTFGDIPDGRPRILINATSLSAGSRFVFTEEKFAKIGSRIDTYPVANAVMASSAFPGVFHDMTLVNHDEANSRSYEHVLDGGPSDNLGTTTLLEMVQQLYRSENKPKGCFLFVVDAYPFPQNPSHVHEKDTRSAFDFIVDTNIAASSDAMLTARRIDLMSDLNVDVRTIAGVDPFQLNTGDDSIWPDQYDVQLRVECAVWHLSLQRLLSPDFGGAAVRNDTSLAQEIREVGGVVNSIPTRYKLTGKAPGSEAKLSEIALQDALFKAAGYLIYLDAASDNTSLLKHVCGWFAEKGVRDIKCKR